MANAELKILMLGARRAGKTSLLAAIVDAFKANSLKQHLIINDVTPDESAQKSLANKVESFKKFLEQKEGRVVLSDSDPTHNFNDHILSVSLPNENGDMQMTFTDANGEFYVQGASSGFEDAKKRILNYDIIIVAVDTPYLMEAVNPDNELCDEVMNEAYNQIDSIHTLLSSINDDDGKNARLVIFTPVKCELWAKRGEINQVTARVEETYNTTIKGLKAFKNIEVLVLPVQTIGNLVFDSHKEAYHVTNAKGDTVSCTEADEKGTVLLSDGSQYQLSRTDILQVDHKAIIEGYNFPRPNSWFRVVSKKYAPYNCEQLAYYILHFLLAKTLRAQKIEKEKKKEGRWWKTLLTGVVLVAGHFISAAIMAAFWYLSERFGTLDIEKLQKALDEIDKRGLWKKNTDGIKVLNKGLLNI